MNGIRRMVLTLVILSALPFGIASLAQAAPAANPGAMALSPDADLLRWVHGCHHFCAASQRGGTMHTHSRNCRRTIPCPRGGGRYGR
jgi:hypothetical protein